MASLSPQPGRRRDGSKTPERDERKHFPSLKKSLSALRSKTPSDTAENVERIPYTPKSATPTPQNMPHSNQPLSVSIPRPSAAADVAFAALHYLPTPLLVLSSVKSVVLANEAMGRLLGMDFPEAYYKPADNSDVEDEEPLLDRLVGRTLSEIGVQIIQNGQRVWVGWEVSNAFVMSDCSRLKNGSRNSSIILLRTWIILPRIQRTVTVGGQLCRA